MIDTKKASYYFVFKNPIAFREYWLPDFKAGFTHIRFYQYPHALLDNLCEMDGRGTGKTEIGLIPDICQAAFLYPKDEGVLTTYRQQHVSKPLDDVFSWFKNHYYWKHFLEYSVKTPTYKMKMKNGFQFYGICVGDSKQAEAIQGVHCCIRFIDEFQQYPDAAWQQFMGTASEKGASYTIDKYTGVPDGRRDSPAWKVSQFDPDYYSKFDNCRLKISKRLVPYFDSNTMADEKKHRNEQSFIHDIDADWGEEQWGYWDWMSIEACINKELPPIIIRISKQDYKSRVPASVLGRIPLRSKEVEDIMIGFDFGWTQPSVIYVFALIKKRWRVLCRINLENKMIPDQQGEILDYLMEFYQVTLAGLDVTGEKGVATTLQDKQGRYAGKNYENRIVGVEFGSKMVVGMDEMGEVKENVKNATCRILKEMFYEREFELFYDQELHADFNSESCIISPATGLVKILTPSTCHIPEAFRCFAYAYYTKYGTNIKKPERHRYSMQLPSFRPSSTSWTKKLINRLK